MADDEPLPPVSGDDLLLQINEPWTGDLPALRERGFLRVLTTYSRTNFFIEHGQGRGVDGRSSPDHQEGERSPA